MGSEEILIKAWAVYMSFYTVFLMVNLTALGVVLEKVVDRRARAVVASAFMAQNIVSFFTAIGMSYLSASMSQTGSLSELKELPPLNLLGLWGGVGNAASHVVIVFLWCVVLFRALMKPEEKPPVSDATSIVMLGRGYWSGFDRYVRAD